MLFEVGFDRLDRQVLGEGPLPGLDQADVAHVADGHVEPSASEFERGGRPAAGHVEQSPRVGEPGFEQVDELRAVARAVPGCGPLVVPAIPIASGHR